MSTIKLSKSQWEFIGKQAGWMKTAREFQTIGAIPAELTIQTDGQKIFMSLNVGDFSAHLDEHGVEKLQAFLMDAPNIQKYISSLLNWG